MTRTLPPVKVMIVDDSAVLRQVLTQALEADPRIKVIATANDPIIAQRRMLDEWPDVVVLDVEMPRMDGITFLRQLMAERPVPVVICSTLTEKGGATTMQALAAGAVSFVTKPTSGLKTFLETQAGELRRMVIEASMSRPRLIAARSDGTKHAAAAAAPPPEGVRRTMFRTTDRFVALGASTGGTQALQAVLLGLPRTCPGMVVVQHMPEGFTALLAGQLDSLCAMEVREARDGDRVIQGLVLIAPGGRQTQVVRDGAFYRVKVRDAPPVNRHRPSVDVLFRAVADNAGPNALGMLLTGMGADGARGLLAMQQAGADTIAQDEASCVVFGMPKEAIALGAAKRVLPLERMADAIGAFGAESI